MRYICFILFYFFYQNTFSQSYSVLSYQKINEVNGNFSGVLDNDDNFGVSVDTIGDLDGNGINDLAVGAFSDDDGGFNRGAVWILFLDDNDNVIATTKISDTSGNFTGILDNDDRFGGAVSYLGDLNNDGLVELAVGADYDGDGGFWHGAVWILSLNADGTVNSHSKISDTQGDFDGFINGDAIFGTDIVNLGDLNNDGVQDLAVGSRRDNDGGGNEGALWILFMNPDFTVNSSQKISNTSGGLGVNLEFEDYFGGAVANIGDLNGDGVIDLAVGSYRDDDQNPNSGSIYILFLNIDGTVNAYQKISNLAGGLNSNLSQGSIFGESIDGIIDYDGDGKVEIIVGAMKQINPTLSFQTGGFFLIELNSNGTVSEEYFYSYGENCFMGQLQNGDLFGGSVCFLSVDGGVLKVAVGSYRDSENGNRKGASWIINLGEANRVVNTLNPTSCGDSDGEITISGLSNNADYTITYELDSVVTLLTITSSNIGEVGIDNLASGSYTNIALEEVLSGCTDTLDSVILTGADLSASISSTEPTGCSSSDGEINISGLANNENYTISYELDSVATSVTVVSTNTGEITIENLSSGSYTSISIEEDSSGCLDTLDSVILTGADLSASVSSTDPTGCNISDGNIVISALSNNESYTISYELDSVATSLTLVSTNTGEITIENLTSGSYTSMSIEEDSSGCLDTLDSVILTGADLSASISSTDPAGCNAYDGEITILNLSNNTEYIIDYILDGAVYSELFVSNNSGVISLTGLFSGDYQSIRITDGFTNCSLDLGFVTLNCDFERQNCFEIKSFFTPNGDGVNDSWFLVPLNQNEVCSYKLLIFNRYGKLIKTLTNNYSQWDGSYNGNKLPSSDYWYVVYFNDGEQDLIYKSHFALKR
jgi:gliding motility-associated-like protein